MSSTGTRVVPTLTEVLDEQRLSKPHTNLSTEPWRDSRPGDEELVPISLDWGDEPAADAAGTPPADSDEVMTPWQVVQPGAVPSSPDDSPFIDLSIDVAPVRPPALHEQVLEVYASPVEASARAVPVDGGEGPDVGLGVGHDAVLAPVSAAARESAVESAPEHLAEPSSAPGLDALAFMDEVPAFLRATPAPAASEEPGSACADEPVGRPAALASPETQAETPAEAWAPKPAIDATAASVAPMPAAVESDAAPAMLDPGRLAVRQGGVHMPGISEERLQAILQQALDRLLRDELPSALVETLIRMSPQLSESLIESLKPSLHLHVMEALSAEPPASPESRRQG